MTTDEATQRDAARATADELLAPCGDECDSNICNEIQARVAQAIATRNRELGEVRALLANYNESTAAYLTDRGDQYETESPSWIGLVDAAREVINGGVEKAVANGDLDDELLERVRKWRTT